MGHTNTKECKRYIVYDVGFLHNKNLKEIITANTFNCKMQPPWVYEYWVLQSKRIITEVEDYSWLKKDNIIKVSDLSKFPNLIGTCLKIFKHKKS